MRAAKQALLIPTYPLSNPSYNSLQYRPQPRRHHRTFIVATALPCHRRRSSSLSLLVVTTLSAREDRATPPLPLERAVFATHSCRHAPLFAVAAAHSHRPPRLRCRNSQAAACCHAVMHLRSPLAEIFRSRVCS